MIYGFEQVSGILRVRYFGHHFFPPSPGHMRDILVVEAQANKRLAQITLHVGRQDSRNERCFLCVRLSVYGPPALTPVLAMSRQQHSYLDPDDPRLPYPLGRPITVSRMIHAR